MNWKKRDADRDIIRAISKKYQCDILVATILARRQITKNSEILFFLEKDPRFLHNPFLFKEMEDAVDRILQAAEEKEKVLIFGDRDVDGITSTTLLCETFEDLGIDYTWRIPEGDEPYGLTNQAVDEFAENYGTLIVTVDCGITNIEEIEHAAELGIDVIVVDHHQAGEELPGAVATLDPKIPEETYPFRDLSGCGVAYKLACALRFAGTELYKQSICLLNIRPVNEAYVVEAVKLVNLRETGRITDTLIPGMVKPERTRVIPFLEGQQIFVWDEALQKKQLQKIFGDSIELNAMDIRNQVSKVFPFVKDLSLLRIKEISKIAKYSPEPFTEIDGFMNIFISFVWATQKIFTDKDRSNLQLVALSTLADLMPLRDENRLMVKLGMEEINKSPRKGLAELMLKQNLTGKRISSEDLSWQITPVINSTGRMGSPGTAIKLFTDNDSKNRLNYADAVIEMNRERKQTAQDSWLQIEDSARKSPTDYNNKLVVVISKEINRGVTGIMASKAVNLFSVPSIIMVYTQDNVIVGSMRSFGNYDLTSLRNQCQDLFIDNGGHAFAAGFSLKEENLPAFIDRLKVISEDITVSEDEEQGNLIDGELPREYMTPDLIKILDLFEPYGIENEPLVFGGKKLKVTGIDLMGKTEKKHVKLTLDCGKYKFPGIIWNGIERVNRDFSMNDFVDVIFQISRNSFNGMETVQLIIQDVAKSV